jgi:hypothetical protein
METILNFVGKGKIFFDIRVSCTFLDTALRRTYTTQHTKSSPVPVMKLYSVRRCAGPHSLSFGISWRLVATYTPRPLYPQRNKPRYTSNKEFLWAPEPVWTFCDREKCPGSVENRTSTPRFSQYIPSPVQQPQNDRSKPKSSSVCLRCRVNCVRKVGLRKLCKESWVTKIV